VEKDFEKWSVKKSGLDVRLRFPSIKERDVFWCSIGVNIGDEENGKSDTFSRPVLVFKKFNRNLFLGIPLTSQNKDNKYYIKVQLKSVTRSVMISHIRLYDSRRLGPRIGKLDKIGYNDVIKNIVNFIPKPLVETWGSD